MSYEIEFEWETEQFSHTRQDWEEVTLTVTATFGVDQAHPDAKYEPVLESLYWTPEIEFGEESDDENQMEHHAWDLLKKEQDEAEISAIDSGAYDRNSSYYDAGFHR